MPDLPPDKTRVPGRMVSQYGSLLLRMGVPRLKDMQLAGDAAQQTFLKAHAHPECFRGQSSEKTWRIRILINTCRNHPHSAWARNVDRKTAPARLHDPAYTEKFPISSFRAAFRGNAPSRTLSRGNSAALRSGIEAGRNSGSAAPVAQRGKVPAAARFLSSGRTRASQAKICGTMPKSSPFCVQCMNRSYCLKCRNSYASWRWPPDIPVWLSGAPDSITRPVRRLCKAGFLSIPIRAAGARSRFWMACRKACSPAPGRFAIRKGAACDVCLQAQRRAYSAIFVPAPTHRAAKSFCRAIPPAAQVDSPLSNICRTVKNV